MSAPAPPAPAGRLELRPGGFYASRDGQLWCCYRVDPQREEHRAAHAVRCTDGRVEYFFMDGRYDQGGEREHTLVKVVLPGREMELLHELESR